MSHPTDYLIVAQDLYLSLRGGGLVLSPLDLDRIRRWRDDGLPLDLVLEGIRRAHRAWHDAGRISRSRPFQLRHVEPHVEELAQIRARRSPGGFPTAPAVPAPSGSGCRGSPPPDPSPRARACDALLKERDGSTGPARAAYSTALTALQEGGDWLLADELQARAYLGVLPRSEQRRLAQTARLDSGPRAGIPRSSYRAMLRANLWEAARRHGQLLRPSDLS